MNRLSAYWLVGPTVLVLLIAALTVDPAKSMNQLEREDPLGNVLENEETDPTWEARRTAIVARIAYKEQLITRLVREELTIEEIVAEFMRLNEELPGSSSLILAKYPGSSNEERTLANVIDYVRIRDFPADEKTRTLQRLETEFQQRYGYRLVLPD